MARVPVGAVVVGMWWSRHGWGWAFGWCRSGVHSVQRFCDFIGLEKSLTIIIAEIKLVVEAISNYYGTNS